MFVLFTALLPGLSTVPGTLKTKQKNPTTTKSTLSEINYSLDGFNNRLYTTKDKVKELVDKVKELIDK